MNDKVDNKWIKITDSKLSDELPEIIKTESDDVIDETTTYLRSNIEKNEKLTENEIRRSEALVNAAPNYILYSDGIPKRNNNKDVKNRLNIERYNYHFQLAVYYTYSLILIPQSFSSFRLENIKTVDNIVKNTNRPMKQRNFHKKETKPFDKDMYDPHLNIADKMQLIDMLNPKRPCERNRMNSHLSFHHLQKRNVDLADQFSSLTDDELDSALEYYEDSGTGFVI